MPKLLFDLKIEGGLIKKYVKMKQVEHFLNGLPDEQYNHLMHHPDELKKILLREKNVEIINVRQKT